MSAIWDACAAELRPGALMGSLLRVVESQEQVATNGLVDSLDEQALLEELLERTKPAHRSGTEKLHYLLAAPFRYPPLSHGSRFGTRFAPSIFYGSRNIDTALSETAYYRFVFWYGMREAPPSARLITQHTSFEASYRCSNGLRLQEPPFAEYVETLASPVDYAATQALGERMRAEGIEAFEYCSARMPDRGLNVALITPAALASRAPRKRQQWLCETRPGAVSFVCAERQPVTVRPLEQFLVAGELPHPPL